MSQTAYAIQLPIFEGPFDLLLHLIRENQINIYDIPIAEIAAQYLDYLQAMREMDLEIASSFVVMAATLLSIKARMLLPPAPPEEGEAEEDARSELVHDLLEYLRFKEAAEAMNALYEQQRRYFSRDNEPELYANLFAAENPLDGKTIADLQSAFAKVLAKAQGRGELLLIEREQITLRDCLEHLYQLMCGHPRGLAFSRAFSQCATRMEYIVTFLALLELARQGVIKASQNELYGEIYLHTGDLSKYERA